MPHSAQYVLRKSFYGFYWTTMLALGLCVRMGFWRVRRRLYQWYHWRRLLSVCIMNYIHYLLILCPANKLEIRSRIMPGIIYYNPGLFYPRVFLQCRIETAINLGLKMGFMNLILQPR